MMKILMIMKTHIGQPSFGLRCDATGCSSSSQPRSNSRGGTWSAYVRHMRLVCKAKGRFVELTRHLCKLYVKFSAVLISMRLMDLWLFVGLSRTFWQKQKLVKWTACKESSAIDTDLLEHIGHIMFCLISPFDHVGFYMWVEDDIWEGLNGCVDLVSGNTGMLYYCSIAFI